MGGPIFADLEGNPVEPIAAAEPTVEQEAHYEQVEASDRVDEVESEGVVQPGLVGEPTSEAESASSHGPRCDNCGVRGWQIAPRCLHRGGDDDAFAQLCES